MANLSALAEVPQSLDQRQIWFTNLLLLGFDPIAQEDKTKVHFCKEMFVHINKKGMEVTLHYLFNRLDSHIAYEEFRDCWPVYDKKQEAQFRKVCSNWLTRISKDDPESKIPRLSASILMSPGGERFEQLMLRFTTHVLRAVCLREAKAEEKQVYLSSFVTSPSSLRPSPSTNPHLLRRALQCHIIRHSHSVAQRLQLNAALHDHWRQFVSDQVKEYRSLGRKKRELEAQLKDASAAPPSTRTEGRGTTWSTPSEDKARRNKMKMVRGYWKSLDDFLSKSSHEREVVSAVAKGNANKYTIDAKDLQFQIPDVVLHLYEAKLREGTAGNTYEGGKLNLVSLLQLWNCALEVTRDKFRECELPSFHEESEEMKELLQAHRVNLATSQSLRASLMEYQQSLQGSIERLERELVALRQSRSECGEGGERGEGDRGSGLQTPQQFHIPPITLPSLGLDLLPPSPHKSQSLSSPDNMGHLQSHLSHLSLPSDSVSTPEAVHNISLSIQRHSRSQRLAPSHSSPSPHPTSHPHHHHPTADTGNERDTSRPSRKTLIPVKSRKNRERQTRPRPPITPLTRGRITSSAHVSEGMEATPTTSRTREPCSPQIKPTNPRLMDTMPAAHNILASQIAAAVAGDSPLSPTSPHTPEHQMHSLADPLSALGKEAFVSQDKIPRTPVKDTTTISASSPCSHEDTSPHVSSVTPSSLLTPVPNITTPSPLSRTLTSSTDTTSLLTPVPNITTPSPLSRTLTSSTDTTLLLTPVPNITTPSPLSHTLTSSTDTTLLLTPVPNITTPSTLSQSTTGTTSLLTPVTNTQASFLSSPKPSPHTSLISLQQPSPSHTSPKSHSHTLTSPWLSKYSASPHVFMSPNSPLHNITTATPRHNVTATPHHNVTATPSHNVTATPSHNVTTTPSQIVTTPHHNVTPHHPSKAMSPLINFSPFVVPPSSTHLPSSRATTPMAVPSFDLMGFGSPLTSGGSTDPAQAGKSPGSLQAVLTDSSGGPVRQSSPSLFPTTDVTIGTPARIASTEASVTTATVMPVPPTGVPQTTTHNQQESKTSLSVPQTTGDPSGATHSPSQSSVAVSPASTSDRVSALKSHLHSVTTTPLAFSMTSKDPSFLLSSQSPTPPFLHDSTLDEDEEQEGGGGEEEGERDVEGKGENKTGLSSILSTSLNGDAVAGTREERSLVEDGKNKSAVEHHSELKPNGIHLGVQIHSSLHDSDLNCYSPSDTSTRQTSSPLRSGVQLIDFSSPSSPHHLPPTLLPPTSSPSSPHHHPPTLPPSSSPPHPPPHLSPRPPHLPPRPLSHPPSPFPQVPTHVPSPPPHPPPANNDDGKEWRQLDISGSHSSLPSTPANQSLKWVVEKHQLSSSSENGLFGGTDSFLVPLSPHSDFSGEDDEQ